MERAAVRLVLGSLWIIEVKTDKSRHTSIIRAVKIHSQCARGVIEGSLGVVA